MEEMNKAYATFEERDRIASLGGGVDKIEKQHLNTFASSHFSAFVLLLYFINASTKRSDAVTFFERGVCFIHFSDAGQSSENTCCSRSGNEGGRHRYRYRSHENAE